MFGVGMCGWWSRYCVAFLAYIIPQELPQYSEGHRARCCHHKRKRACLAFLKDNVVWRAPASLQID